MFIYFMLSSIFLLNSSTFSLDIRYPYISIYFSEKDPYGSLKICGHQYCKRMANAVNSAEREAIFNEALIEIDAFIVPNRSGNKIFPPDFTPRQEVMDQIKNSLKNDLREQMRLCNSYPWWRLIIGRLLGSFPWYI